MLSCLERNCAPPLGASADFGAAGSNGCGAGADGGEAGSLGCGASAAGGSAGVRCGASDVPPGIGADGIASGGCAGCSVAAGGAWASAGGWSEPGPAQVRARGQGPCLRDIGSLFHSFLSRCSMGSATGAAPPVPIKRLAAT